jgi:hypothetical protein
MKSAIEPVVPVVLDVEDNCPVTYVIALERPR